MKHMCLILTDMKNRYQILTDIKNRYRILKAMYEIFTVVNHGQNSTKLTAAMSKYEYFICTCVHHNCVIFKSVYEVHLMNNANT